MTAAKHLFQPGSATGVRLLLLHGMDGTGAVWDGVISRLDHLSPTAILAPDLAGHGTGPRLEHYSLDSLAEDVLHRFPQLGAGDVPLVIVGHSLGGVVGLTLAGLHPELPVRQVIAAGCKTVWTDDDLAMMARVSARPPQTFADQDEAVSRFLRVSGLDGLLAPELARSGISVHEQGWRLAVDPPVHGVAGGDFAALLAKVGTPVLLVTGEQDPMAPSADLARFDAPLRVVPGMGHSLHVQDPTGFADLIMAELSHPGSR